ncbi:MAG: HlyD family efflux transporter periplasmic adaptor subunit [Pseudomonadota bacterium]
MKIRHERPMSDLSFQVRAPLGLELATGDVVSVACWSLNGLEFPHDTDVLPSQGVLSIPFQGVDIRFPVRFTPGGADRELIFEGLTGRQRETLAVFYRSILSGKMASTEDIITSLDTPVDLVPMEETEEERVEDSKGKTPRILRVLWSLSLYAMVGAVVFGMLGQQIWSRLSAISVGQARVVAELVDHRAPAGAYVERILVAEGDVVAQGDTLIVLTSPGHTGTLTEIRSDIRLAEADVRAARRALDLHLDGLEDARRPFVAALERAITARRLRDFFADDDLSEVRRALKALAVFDAGLSQATGDFHERRAFLEGVLRQRETALGKLKRALSAEKSIGGAADIVALEDGIVTDLPVFADQFLPRGQIALVLETSGPRHIEGWLDEGMAAAVFPGMAANMIANSGGATRRIEGQVVEVVAMANPDGAGSFGLRVLVLPAAWVGRDAPELLRPDAPIQLSLERSRPWLNRIREVFYVRS